MRSRSQVATRVRSWLAGALLLLSSGAAAATEGPGSSLQPALLDVSVNGRRSAEPMLFLRDSDGAFYASEAALQAWRIRLPASAAVRHEGETWYRIDGIAALRATFSPQDQAIAIDADPALFDRQRDDLAQIDEAEMTAPGSGGFVNYDVLFEHASGETNLSGVFELGAFTRRGVAVTSFIAGAGDGGSRLVRLESSWTIDRPASLTSIRIGDGISSSGPGGVPVRFAGFQYARNFAVQPGYVTMPLPMLQGSAAVPSVVDVYVNNALQASREVQPGPFEIANVPVQSGGGTVHLVVHDLLGREIVSEQSYYASARMLRRGLHDFSYEAGFLRRGFGIENNRYGELMASTTHRYGLSDHLTAEAHVQAGESVQMAGVALTASVFDLGLVGGSVSVSRSDRGTGARGAVSVEHHTARFSFGVRSEYSTRDYSFLGIAGGERLPRITTQAFADLPVLGGSVGLSLLHRDHRDRADETLAGLFVRHRIGSAASVQLYARRVVAGERQTIAGLAVALALGGRRSASASFERKGRSSLGHASYQSNPPAGPGGGYRVTAGLGTTDSIEGAYTHNFRSASLGAQAAYADGRTGLRLSAAGGLGLIGKRIFASRTLGSSFAAVRVEGYPGVRVYADNQLLGVTDRDGIVIGPALRAYERNVLRVDEGDLPIDVRLDRNEIAVRPFARTGAVVRFSARRERGVLMRVRLEDGGLLPAGASITVEGRGGVHVAVSGGEVYVPDLAGTARLRADWAGRSCGFSAIVPGGDDPQPRLDGLVCREVDTYAAR